jgi:predicted choloylglycine hydrolase
MKRNFSIRYFDPAHNSKEIITMKTMIGKIFRRTGLVFSLVSIGLSGCSKDRPKTITPEHQGRIDRLYADYDRNFRDYLANAVKALGKETIVLERLSNRFTVPQKLDIHGTAYEVGYTIGHIARQYNRILPSISKKPANKKLNQKIVDMYRKIYPQYLDIVKGIADAYNTEFDQVDLVHMEFNFFHDLWFNLLRYRDFYTLTDFGTFGDTSPSTNCSVASYYTGKRQIVGRNFDNPSDRPHFFATTQITGCYKVMAHIVYFIGHWVADGINEKGLAICAAANSEEYFWTEDYPDEPAVFLGYIPQIILDTCATVDEAIEKIRSVRVWFPNEGIHWLIADPSGKSVIVEFDQDRNMVVMDRNAPYELMTNLALQKGEDYVMRNCTRYRTAKSMLEAGIGNTADMLRVMSAIRQTSDNSHTLWTSIMDLNNRTLEIHYRKEYNKKYKFGF